MRKTRWLAAFLLVAQLCVAQGPPAPPPAEQLTRDWLAAFNSGDRTTLPSFLEKYRPSDVAHVDDLINFHSRTGGFDFEKVEESTPPLIALPSSRKRTATSLPAWSLTSIPIRHTRS